MPRRLFAVVAASTLWSICGSASVRPADQQVPQFRAGVNLTRLEVRVVDDNGSPVRGLTAADFEVREDGNLQEVALFQRVAVDDSPVAASRTFFIVLGRGQLEAPAKAIQALIDFLRTKARPADRVGVAAYLKVIPLTTNHEAVARFLEGLRARQTSIEGLLVRDGRSGLGVPQPLAAETRAAIETLFRDGALDRQDLAAGAGGSAWRYNDPSYLRIALEYLSLVEGEKHVVFVTQRPFINVHIADKPPENYWIRRAAGAHASLHFINAGGLHVDPPNPSRFGRPVSPLGFEPGLIDAQEWMAAQTGGTVTFFQYADKLLTALDRATHHYYVLGYYPARDVAPDQYRAIEVKVKRANVSVHYRHGYQDRPRAETADDYRRAITEARLGEAALRLIHPYVQTTGAAAGRPSTHMSLKIPNAKTQATEIQVAVTLDPVWIYFQSAGDGYAADVDLRFLADDAQRAVVGEHNQRLSLTLTADELQRLRTRWRPQSLTFDITLNVKAKPTYVRAMAYQFDSDRTTSVQLRLPR